MKMFEDIELREDEEITEAMIEELSDNRGDNGPGIAGKLIAGIRAAASAISAGAFSNSSLATYIRLSPNHSGLRTHKIDYITPHCTAGLCSVETLAAIFATPTRGASCQYGIGNDGRIGLIVEEKNRSWCSSSSTNDQRAVTIECSSGSVAPYSMNDKVWSSLIKLCVDICKRNGKKKLIWLGTREKTLAYSPKSTEMVLTAHRWYAAKACPGDWLYYRMGTLAAEVTKKLSGSTFKEYRVKVVCKRLHVRAKAKKASKHVMYIYKGGVFTIVQENSKKTWGKLKSGAGWISLNSKYVKKL